MTPSIVISRGCSRGRVGGPFPGHKPAEERPARRSLPEERRSARSTAEHDRGGPQGARDNLKTAGGNPVQVLTLRPPLHYGSAYRLRVTPQSPQRPLPPPPLRPPTNYTTHPPLHPTHPHYAP